MGDMSSEGAHLNAGIDLSQFYQVFFEEAGENLENMEQLLLELDIEAADDEELNAIFRCAHSIKGGAATFGFADVAELTHQMETLLDKLRRHELADLFKEITDLGTIEPLDAGKAADGMRRFKIVTATADSELLDLMTFHVAREALRLEPLSAGFGASTTTGAASALAGAPGASSKKP